MIIRVSKAGRWSKIFALENVRFSITLIIIHITFQSKFPLHIYQNQLCWSSVCASSGSIQSWVLEEVCNLKKCMIMFWFEMFIWNTCIFWKGIYPVQDQKDFIKKCFYRLQIVHYYLKMHKTTFIQTAEVLQKKEHHFSLQLFRLAFVSSCFLLLAHLSCFFLVPLWWLHIVDNLQLSLHQLPPTSQAWTRTNL